jgi:hypothetical protein
MTTDSQLADEDAGSTPGPYYYAPTPGVPISTMAGLAMAEGWYDGEGEMLYGEADESDPSYGDTFVHNNGRRAGCAVTALVALTVFARATGMLSSCNDEDVDTVIGDLFADIHHLADSLELDYAALLAHGQMHYDAELLGE